MSEAVTDDLVADLRKASSAVYLATEQGPAAHMSTLFSKAATEIQHLQRVHEEWFNGPNGVKWYMAENTKLRKALGAVAIDALQRDWEGIEEWARSVRVDFPDGAPEVSL